MKRNLVAGLFLFSGTLAAETDYSGDFYRALAAAGANIEVDAPGGGAQRLAFILETWKGSGGKVVIRRFNELAPANNGQPLSASWLVELARSYGGRITFADRFATIRSPPPIDGDRRSDL